MSKSDQERPVESIRITLPEDTTDCLKGNSQGGEESPTELDSLPPVLTVNDLIRFLRMSKNPVYDALRRGEIPGAVKVGRSYRISRDALLSWMGQGCGLRSEKK